MALYNNGFPVTYPQMYPQYTYQQPMQTMQTVPTQPVVTQNAQQAQQQNSSISWVQGEAGAKAYPVAAGNTVMLLDSEDSVFYLKSTDISGMPQPLRIFEFKERTNQTTSQPLLQQQNMDNYVTWDKLEERLSEIVNKQNSQQNNSQRNDKYNRARKEVENE